MTNVQSDATVNGDTVDYEVGYKKPPRHTVSQRQIGQSGKPAEARGECPSLAY